MKLSHFNFELPDELLAEYPSEHRDESRLMVLNREKQTIEHKQAPIIKHFLAIPGSYTWCLLYELNRC